MANEMLFLTTQQVAYFAGVEVKDVRRRTKSVPGRVPLYARQEAGIAGDCFEASNVVAVWPAAGSALLEATMGVKATPAGEEPPCPGRRKRPMV